MDKDSLLNIIAYLALITFLIWFAMKQLGYINTPWYIELVPVVTLGILVGAGMETLKNTKSDVKELKHDVKSIDKRVIHIEAELSKPRKL